MAEDTRDGNTIVAVALKSQLENGELKEGIHPGRVTLSWLRLAANVDKWVEVDPVTRRRVTASQAAKAAAATPEG